MTRRVAFVLWVCASGCIASEGSAQLEPGEPQSGFELEEWLGGVGQATDIAFLSDGRAVVTRKGGQIVVVTADGNVQSDGALIAVDTESEKGLLGVVVDDDDNLYLYASNGGQDSDKHGVYRGTVSSAGEVSLDLSRSVVGTGLEGPANHDGGGLVIHRGQLYVGVGDTGFNSSPPTNRYATCLNKANAKILRVNLDGSIPADNPLVSMPQVTGCDTPRGAFEMLPPDERIYAWGLRNPWRLYIDPQTDLLWIGDVGEVTQEEITVGGKGAHHGYPFFEGTREHGELDGLAGCTDVVPSSACVPPQHGYPRGDGVSVTGGLIPPAGCGWGAYEQRYFFGDYGNGRVWTLDLRPDRSGALPDSRRDFAQIDSNVSFRMGPDGAMYVVSYGGGAVYRVAPNSVPASCDPSGAPARPAAPSAGASGAPAPAGAGAAGTGAAGTGAAGAGAAPAAGSEDGCSCRLVRPQPAATPVLGLGLLSLLVLTRLRARPR